MIVYLAFRDGFKYYVKVLTLRNIIIYDQTEERDVSCYSKRVHNAFDKSVMYLTGIKSISSTTKMVYSVLGCFENNYL